MARSTGGDGKSSQVEATTLFFPKKTVWQELAEAKRLAKKRASSANGTYSKLLTRLVNEEHLDRFAAKQVLAFYFIEDDSDLHTAVHHFFDGMRKLGVLERAMIPDDYELFDEYKVGPKVDEASGGKRRPGRPRKDKDEANANGVDAENVRPFPQPGGVAAE